MRIEPNYFSECPATDTLSLLLADIHMEGGSYIFAELASPWAFHIHTPNVACFHIVLSGQAWLKLDDDSAILLKTGELVILPLGTSHTMYARYGDAVKAINLEKLIHTHASKHPRFLKAGGHGETTEMICGYFKFDMSLARPLLQSLPPILHIPNHTGYMRDWLNIGISFMMSETKQPRVAHQAIVNRICDLLFIECMREYVENLDVNSDSWLSALKDPYLARTLSAIHRYPSSAWNLESLAKESGLSRSALAARFSQHLKQGIMEYLTAYRMRLVTWWLRSSNLTLAQIAEKVGYSSEAALSQAFKREIGHSPRQYRLQKQLDKQKENFSFND